MDIALYLLVRENDFLFDDDLYLEAIQYELDHELQVQKQVTQWTREMLRTNPSAQQAIKQRIESLESLKSACEQKYSDLVKNASTDNETDILKLSSADLLRDFKGRIKALERSIAPPPPLDPDFERQIEQARESSISALLGLEQNRKNVPCPFHEDKHPSAHVYDDKRLTCFVCGETWDQIAVTKKLYSLDFKQAVLHLCSNT